MATKLNGAQRESNEMIESRLAKYSTNSGNFIIDFVSGKRYTRIDTINTLTHRACFFFLHRRREGNKYNYLLFCFVFRLSSFAFWFCLLFLLFGWTGIYFFIMNLYFIILCMSNEHNALPDFRFLLLFSIFFCLLVARARFSLVVDLFFLLSTSSFDCLDMGNRCLTIAACDL